MLLRVVSLVSILLLQACGTIAFTPSVYPLRDGLIPPFQVSGSTTIINAQPATAEVIVYSYGGSRLASNLNAITATMVQQATDELKKNGRVALGGQPRSIALKVNSLLSEYIFFFWKSKIHFEATLGDGTVITKEVPHASGDLAQDLNGCIAEGVMVLFNDKQLLAYLAK